MHTIHRNREDDCVLVTYLFYWHHHSQTEKLVQKTRNRDCSLGIYSRLLGAFYVAILWTYKWPTAVNNIIVFFILPIHVLLDVLKSTMNLCRQNKISLWPGANKGWEGFYWDSDFSKHLSVEPGLPAGAVLAVELSTEEINTAYFLVSFLLKARVITGWETTPGHSSWYLSRSIMPIIDLVAFSYIVRETK